MFAGHKEFANNVQVLEQFRALFTHNFFLCCYKAIIFGRLARGIWTAAAPLLAISLQVKTKIFFIKNNKPLLPDAHNTT